MALTTLPDTYDVKFDLAYATAFDMSDIETRALGGAFGNAFEHSLDRLGQVILGGWTVDSVLDSSQYIERPRVIGGAPSDWDDLGMNSGLLPPNYLRLFAIAPQRETGG